MRSKYPSTSGYPQQPVCKRGRYLVDPTWSCSSPPPPSSSFSSSRDANMSDVDTAMETSPSKVQETSEDVEKKEEEKLRAKYPQAAQGPHGGHAAFIQKRLAKGQKFFDSGDYNMYKQRGGNQLFGNKPRNVPVPGAPGAAPPGTAAAPNPMAPMPTSMAMPMGLLPAGPPTGAAIPTPETVPARKTSIIQQPKFPMQAPPSSAT